MNEIPRRLQQQAVESSRFAGLGHSALGAALFSRDVGNWSDSEVAPALYWNIGRACVLNPRKRGIYTRMIVEASLIAPFGKCDGIPRGINLSAARCSRGYSRRGSIPPVPSPPPPPCRSRGLVLPAISGPVSSGKSTGVCLESLR